jgi:F-type H+-transporting ATPase subunit b
MILYVLMSRLFFKPVREFLEKRAASIAEDRDEAKKLQDAALISKAEYEEKLKAVHKEAEEILSASRKAAMKQQGAIIDQAKSEASAIMKQADMETVSEKQRIKDEVRQEMSSLAMALTAQFADKADAPNREVLLEEALKEMGGETWLRS